MQVPDWRVCIIFLIKNTEIIKYLYDFFLNYRAQITTDKYIGKKGYIGIIGIYPINQILRNN